MLVDIDDGLLKKLQKLQKLQNMSAKDDSAMVEKVLQGHIGIVKGYLDFEIQKLESKMRVNEVIIESALDEEDEDEEQDRRAAQARLDSYRSKLAELRKEYKYVLAVMKTKKNKSAAKQGMLR